MSLEQEIKMVVPANAVIDFTQLAWLMETVVAGPDELHIVSTYFDTPDFALQEFGVGLRMRKINDQWLQTVKCSGHAVDGLHQRKEWEHELNSAEFDLSLLRKTDLAPLIDNPDVWPKLMAIFTTDFIRQQWLLQLDDKTQVELAYDSGLVIAGAKQAKIHEIELELKSGDLKKMTTFAGKLKDALSLELSDVSKAAQGYRMYLSC